MNSPMASFTAHSVFGTKPALVSVPTVGTIFSTEAETPSVSGCSSTISLSEDQSQPNRKNWKEGQPRETKLKFTYKEQREWETIEETIAALEEEVAELDTHLVFGGFRPDEFIWRLNGDSYMLISGGRNGERKEKMGQITVEICCGSYYDALEAAAGGAERIEYHGECTIRTFCRKRQ